VFGALALTVILAVAGACGGKDSTAPITDPECVIPTVTNFVDSAVARVVITDFAFHPASITIKAGQTVKWKHCGPEVDQHTVTADAGTLLDSPYLSKGATYTKLFDVAGTNPYHCIPHDGYMAGTVIVQP
jgi:plastocyanin